MMAGNMPPTSQHHIMAKRYSPIVCAVDAGTGKHKLSLRDHGSALEAQLCWIYHYGWLLAIYLSLNIRFTPDPESSNVVWFFTEQWRRNSCLGYNTCRRSNISDRSIRHNASGNNVSFISFYLFSPAYLLFILLPLFRYWITWLINFHQYLHLSIWLIVPFLTGYTLGACKQSSVINSN